MSKSPVTRVVVIANENGLHARPAELFARAAAKCEARIEVLCRGERVDAKSILELLTLNATPGTELTIEADGSDADQAVDALAQLVESRFAEIHHAGEQPAE